MSKDEWCELHIIVSCGSLCDALKVTNIIIERQKEFETEIHENTIKRVEIVRKKQEWEQ